jgi:hypothetical protein
MRRRQYKQLDGTEKLLNKESQMLNILLVTAFDLVEASKNLLRVQLIGSERLQNKVILPRRIVWVFALNTVWA